MEDDDVSLSRCSNSAIQMFLPVLTELSSQQVVMVSRNNVDGLLVGLDDPRDLFQP